MWSFIKHWKIFTYFIYTFYTTSSERFLGIFPNLQLLDHLYSSMPTYLHDTCATTLDNWKTPSLSAEGLHNLGITCAVPP